MHGVSCRNYLSLFVFILFSLPVSTNAQVAQIVFTTDPQTISPNELSGPITIQAQDASGNSYQTPETIDLEFLSSSPTGEFLGSTGNPATKTMNTNTANRTFYYRDSSEGDFTLTINAIGRTSGEKWSLSQDVTVSSSASVATTSVSTEEKTSITNNTTTSQSSSGAASSHYSATVTTYLTPDIKFEASAGRARVAVVGAPLQFQAAINSDYLKNAEFNWSFGDGTIDRGAVVTHSYSYPGDYVVVLNILLQDGSAVTRTNVKIVPDTLSITYASPERIEVFNDSKNEINLYGRALVKGNFVFPFPQDTIITAGQKISFSTEVTGLRPNNITDAFIIVVGVNPKQADLEAKIKEGKKAQLVSMEDKIHTLQQDLATNVAESKKEQEAATSQNTAEETESTSTSDIATNIFEPKVALASAVASEPVEEPGIIASWWHIIRRFFLGD